MIQEELYDWVKGGIRMTDKLVLTEKKAGIGTITLHDPAKMNALSQPLALALTEALEETQHQQAHHAFHEEKDHRQSPVLPGQGALVQVISVPMSSENHF